MAVTYAAHIVTDAEQGYGDPEITIMTQDDSGASDVIASYPLNGGAEPGEVLDDAGWRTIGDETEAGHGYVIVEVEPAEVDTIVRHVTSARAQAEAELQRRDTAWRTVIRDAMLDGGSATAIAGVAGVSRERVYQIRDGRR